MPKRLRSARSALPILALLGLQLSAFPVRALEFSRAESYRVQEDTVVEADRWVTTGQLDVSGIVEGELVALATNAHLSGQFGDHLAVYAQSITFSGQAEDRVKFLSDGLIQVSGRLAKGIAAVGRSIHLERTTQLGGYGLLVGEHVITEAHAGDSLHILAKSVTLSGTIEGNLRVIAENIVVLPGTTIGGDFAYSMASELVLGDQVQLGGELIRRSAEESILSFGTVTVRSYLFLQIGLWMNAFMAGMLMISLMPVHTARAINQVRTAPGRSMLTGALFLFIAPLIASFFFRSMVGLTAALLIGAAGAGALYLGSIAVALALGGLVFARSGQASLARTVLALVAGLTFFLIVAFIPVLNLRVWVAVAFLGTGAMLRAFFESQILVIRQAREASPPPRPPFEDTDK